MIRQADQKLQVLEGHGLEKLVAILYEERSRKNLPGFSLSHKIEGFWDRSVIEIDLLAIDELEKKIRFGSCKRSEEKLISSIVSLKKCAEKFLKEFSQYRNWKVEYVMIAPLISPSVRMQIAKEDVLSEDFADLFEGLK